MSKRIATKYKALERIPFAAQSCLKAPFSTRTTVGATARWASPPRTLGRWNVHWNYQSWALMSSQPPASSDIHPNAYNSDVDDLNKIRSSMSCPDMLDSVWGFVIYRCSGNHQGAWDRLLQTLRSDVEESLAYYKKEDMLKFHDLHVIDDKALYGATSHQVRTHFDSWAPKNLAERVRPGATEPEDESRWMSWVHAKNAPRYHFCLFADDICLESVDYDHFRKGSEPVVKLLCRDWQSPLSPEELSRGYVTPTPYHDGITEYWEEDVGWMYMPLTMYMGKYHLLRKDGWDHPYVRPPFIDGGEDESCFVGHWRRKTPSEAIHDP